MVGSSRVERFGGIAVWVSAQNPRCTIPRAARLIFYRIFFYFLSVFFLGMIVPYNSPKLAFATKQSTSASASPFVVAIVLAGINVLPGILNGCILIFVFSAATSDLYISSRTLFVRARTLQGLPAEKIVYETPLGVGGSWFGLCFCVLIAFTKNFGAFVYQGTSKFDYEQFITGYIAILTFLIFFFGYKLAYETKAVGPMEADLYSGLAGWNFMRLNSLLLRPRDWRTRVGGRSSTVGTFHGYFDVSVLSSKI